MYKLRNVQSSYFDDNKVLSFFQDDQVEEAISRNQKIISSSFGEKEVASLEPLFNKIRSFSEIEYYHFSEKCYVSTVFAVEYPELVSKVIYDKFLYNKYHTYFTNLRLLTKDVVKKYFDVTKQKQFLDTVNQNIDEIKSTIMKNLPELLDDNNEYLNLIFTKETFDSLDVEIIVAARKILAQTRHLVSTGLTEYYKNNARKYIIKNNKQK